MNNNLTTIDILGELFGSKVKARLLKFLFHHPQEAFRIGEIARRIQSNYNTTHSYMKDLYRIGLVKIQDEPRNKDKKEEKKETSDNKMQNQGETITQNSISDSSKISPEAPTALPLSPDHIKNQKLEKTEEEPEGRLFIVNRFFPLYKELSTLVLKTNPISEKDVVSELKNFGRVRLAVISGAFLNASNCPVDFFLVVDDLDKEKFEEFMKKLEAEVGKPLNYTFMDTSEFTYRYNIYDRFIRNVFKNAHRTLINELKFEL